MGDLEAWTPGYLPSNGTMGDMFRAEWCDRCVRDHSSHIGGECSTPSRWACSIFTGSLICYPGPGPDEWESRDPGAGRGLDVRCTAFQACWPCKVPGSVAPERRPRRRRQRAGQLAMPGVDLT